MLQRYVRDLYLDNGRFGVIFLGILEEGLRCVCMLRDVGWCPDCF